jgi:hypothetical protein
MMLIRSSLTVLVILISVTWTSCSEREDQISASNSTSETLVTIYAHEFNGVAPGHKTPGLSNCDPDTAAAQIYQKLRALENMPLSSNMILPKKSLLIEQAEGLFELHRLTFLPLTDANWSEGHNYTAVERQQAESAVRFAKRHNQLSFQNGRVQILRLCPDAKLSAN